MIFSICLSGLFLVLFILTLIWYFLKVRCFKYTGRALGEAVSVTKRGSNDDGEEAQEVVFEYEVGPKKYKLKRIRAMGEPVLYEGNTVDIVYDTDNPARAELLHRIKDEKTAKKRWMVLPLFMLTVLILILFFTVPEIAEFSSRQKDKLISVSGIIIALIMCVCNVLKLKNLDLKLNQKKKAKFIAIIILFFWLLILMVMVGVLVTGL